MGNPKFLEKAEGSLRRLEEELKTSAPAYSIEAGEVGNTDKLLWCERDPRMKSYLCFPG